MIIRRNLFIYSILKEYSLDAIFPLQDYPVRTRTRTKLVSWCADFQHRHYPEFFSKTQILGRNTRTKLALRNNDDLVISSYDASTDLKKYFRVRDGLNIHIFHFVSVINDLGSSNFDEIKAKYKLPDKYFLVSNQFHKHKNHKVLLQALVKLKKMDIITHMAMTGKFPDKTNAPYLKDLQNLINENFLTDQVTMLGVISRREQLILMKNSQAVLQPSLFEGWSKVIEDAKSLQVPVVASNIKVNIEQLGENGVYFDPHNPYELAAILKGYPERNMNDVFYEEYHQRIKNAARELLDILLPS